MLPKLQRIVELKRQQRYDGYRTLHDTIIDYIVITIAIVLLVIIVT